MDLVPTLLAYALPALLRSSVGLYDAFRLLCGPVVLPAGQAGQRRQSVPLRPKVRIWLKRITAPVFVGFAVRLVAETGW